MKKRLLTAAWLIPLLAIIIFFGTVANQRWQLNNSETTRLTFKYLFLSCVILITLFAIKEVVYIDSKMNLRIKIIVLTFSSLIASTTLLSDQDLGWKLTIILIISLSLMMLMIPVISTFSIKDVFFTFIFSIIISISIKLLALLVLNNGWPVLLWLILIPVVTDTMAYFGGSAFGKNKLAPNISPKKTVEGAMVGLFFGTLIPVLYLFFWKLIDEGSVDLLYTNTLTGSTSHLEPWNIILVLSLLTPILSIICQIGDLSFSAIKREYKIKDFSSLLSEHGGILDRLDSVVFVTLSYFIINIIVQLFI